MLHFELGVHRQAGCHLCCVMITINKELNRITAVVSTVRLGSPTKVGFPEMEKYTDKKIK